MLHPLTQNLEWLTAHQRHIFPGDPPNLFELGAVPDDHQLLFRHCAERLHDETHLLVWRHAGGCDVVVPLLIAQRVRSHVHGRVYHLRVPAVAFSYAPRNKSRVGEERVHAASGSRVPYAHVVEDEPSQPPLHAPVKPRLREILVLHIPGIADGRVNVGYVELVRPRQHPLRHRVGAGDHHVVAGQVDLLYGERHQREIGLVFLPCHGHMLEERHLRRFPHEE